MLIRSEDGPAWIASTEDDVRAVLGDERFGVVEVEPGGQVGTIRWLRGSVSRFVNGPEHTRRRALVEAELAGIDPVQLAAAARDEARRMLAAGSSEVAERAPTASLARLLGAADPDATADAVIECAAAYFPGADHETEQRADAAVARLLGLLGGVELEVAVARISLLIQGCAATAATIGAVLANDGPLDAVLREHPPLPAMRRVAREDVRLEGVDLTAGDLVVCDIGAASDPATLTFGAGVRPCPGEAQARATATGVLDALRES